jgi:hypothetical protein
MKVRDQKVANQGKPKCHHFERKINWFELKKKKELKRIAHKLKNQGMNY